jgi:aminobenzoyl-glutamate transport protein
MMSIGKNCKQNPANRAIRFEVFMDRNSASPSKPRFLDRVLNAIEWAGNKLPDPAVLFVIVLIITWILSAALSQVTFAEIDPRTQGKDAAGKQKEEKPIEVKNQLSGHALAEFLAKMVKTFTDFPPLGVVLVALLGVGVAEHVGFINAILKAMLRFTPGFLLTPMLLLVALLSHTAGDSGYVLVIPLGGIIFSAAGRHPLAGIVAAFAGVSGGFSANPLPCGLDPLLQGFTQSAAQLIDPSRQVNPLCNYYFTALSSIIIIAVGWFLTDRIIEPRLRGLAIDGDPKEIPQMGELTPGEVRGLWWAVPAMGIGIALLALAAWPVDSPLRGANGSLTASRAPLMEAIVPLIFILFLIPGIVFGYAAKTVHSHKDIIKGMSKSMSTMGYYLVLAFFAALFTYAFRESNLGALLAVKGANFLKAIGLPAEATIIGIILLSTVVNLLIGSASAKWAILGPIFVPMLMQLGLSPELTQGAYRIGDSSTNIITPLMPYFPLVVVYCQRYVKNTGIGTLVSLMLPYSVTFIAAWTVLLLGYWKLGLPLGIGEQTGYTYPP